MADSSMNVAAEIAELRGEMAAGFARLEGQLNLINQTQQRTAQDVEDLESSTDARFKVMEDRVSALEARRWPIGSLAALSGVVSAAVAGVALLVK
jgi:hypothetical protein